jgi:hypothetical protein
MQVKTVAERSALDAQIKINPSRGVTHLMIVRFGARIGL